MEEGREGDLKKREKRRREGEKYRRKRGKMRKVRRDGRVHEERTRKGGLRRWINR